MERKIKKSNNSFTEMRVVVTRASLRNEEGIALIMVLILSAIALIVMAGLLYVIMSGTQVSGIQKRYKSVREAAIGGLDVNLGFVDLRGDTSLDNDFITSLQTTGITTAILTGGSCAGTNALGTAFTGLAAKFNTPATSWSGCDKSITINPKDASTYDMSFDLPGPNPASPTYRVYSKVVDTVEGNSGQDTGLVKGGVVANREIAPGGQPYLYQIELYAENPSNPSERAKYSILYQY